MATKTENFELTKPSADDFYDIEVHNSNMDIIDEELLYLSDELVIANDKINITADVKVNFDNHIKATNPHNITPSTIGLGNVNNTSDINKPVSTAQASAIAKAKEEANATALGYVQNSMTGHNNGDIHVTSADKAKWNENVTKTNELNSKFNEQSFELIKTQNVIFSNVLSSTSVLMDVTGINSANYKELIFEFIGDITMKDAPSLYEYGERRITAYLNVNGIHENGTVLSNNDGKKSVAFADFLYNTKKYIADTLTMDFNSKIRVKTDTNKYRDWESATTSNYTGIIVEGVSGVTEKVDGKTCNFQVKLSVSAEGSNNQITANFNGNLNIYGKRGY